jgi:uncharacterized membrane protein YhaH (DUF805 family)
MVGFFQIAGILAALIAYGVYGCVTARRLRDCGQSTLFIWCFVFGGAIIPIVMGLALDAKPDDQASTAN